MNLSNADCADALGVAVDGSYPAKNGIAITIPMGLIKDLKAFILAPLISK
jgi:hypothetical protein